MDRCRKCKVPLSGFLSTIPKTLFGIKVSQKTPDLCNKCEAKDAKYFCQICNREIDESVALTHVKTEEYLLELIKRDHPEWNKDENTCHKCLEYYRTLVKEAEI